MKVMHQSSHGILSISRCRCECSFNSASDSNVKDSCDLKEHHVGVGKVYAGEIIAVIPDGCERCDSYRGNKST